MTCLNPYFARRSLTPNKNGKYPLCDFVPYRELSDRTRAICDAEIAANTALVVPCGQCLGCRLDKANDWAIRCVHEAKLHLQNCFITLTYKPAFLPADNSLHRDHLQLFFKRLRRYLSYHDNLKIRFLCCGEYGSLNFRPHYHILCFGWFPSDVRRLKTVAAGYNLFRSPLLEELWPYGFNVVGAVTFESARYVAKYSLKKQIGKNSIMYDTLSIIGFVLLVYIIPHWMRPLKKSLIITRDIILDAIHSDKTKRKDILRILIKIISTNTRL